MPFLDLPTPTVGSISLPWFMILIVIGIAAGTEYSRWRAIQRGLSVKITVDCTLWMVASGFVISHFFAVVFYHPDLLEQDWKNLLPWYNFSISSVGGFLGAGLAIFLFLKVWKKVPVWAYTDDLAIGFILGFAFGRLGCATAHDHIGKATDFFLAVRFPDDWPRAGVSLGTRHDLGLYEALLSFAIFGLFLLLDRNKDRFHGLYSGLLLVIYCPFRLGFDFLRADDLTRASQGLKSDLRWGGLTFAQWGVIGLFLLGVWMLAYRRGKGQQDISGEAARDFGPGELPPADGPPEAA
jgi:phosphatidylglycerol:prolipoprotein diacylglycerol transferase